MNDIRPDSDHYPTDENAVRALLSVEAFPGGIWEPCAGTGEMAEVLREAGYTVRATTIENIKNDPKRPKRRVTGGVDFLKETKTSHPNIVTNFPYGRLYGKKDRMAAEKMIRHALSVGATKVAAIFKMGILGGEGRGEGLFKEYPPARIYIFSDRVTMYPAGYEGKRGTDTVNYVWIVWEFPMRQCMPSFGWLNSKNFKSQ